MLSGAFRPFFLLATAWAAIAVPVWLAAWAHGYSLRGPLPALFWRALRSGQFDDLERPAHDILHDDDG